ncbi:energy transducer TonB [Spirosoma panaciterrae]|uniref:energy transducer TonB n=1 Tax=Spirosoma panaciterrae TaxID=496058 RepID=UPI00035E3D83|nr:energy transducer TonB [Spirosoma panaciterrae]
MRYLISGLVIASIVLLAPSNVLAQTRANIDTTVYTIVEKFPEFPGGYKGLTNYLQAMVHYPAEAQKAKLKGRVFVSFIVERDGNLRDIQLLKGLGYGCDEEALRAVQAMPCWEPGSQSGKPIRVKYNLPIGFGMDSYKRK